MFLNELFLLLSIDERVSLFIFPGTRNNFSIFHAVILKNFNKLTLKCFQERFIFIKRELMYLIIDSFNTEKMAQQQNESKCYDMRSTNSDLTYIFFVKLVAAYIHMTGTFFSFICKIYTFFSILSFCFCFQSPDMIEMKHSNNS